MPTPDDDPARGPFLRSDAPIRPRRARRLRAVAFALVGLLVLAAVAVAERADDLHWAAPFLVSPSTLAPTDSTGYGLNDVTCPGPTRCVAIDGRGAILTSHASPTDANDWVPTSSGLPDTTELNVAACAGEGLCVAAGYAGVLATSTDAFGPTPHWTVAQVPGATGSAEDLACPSTTACIAVDDQGAIWTSTNPAAGASSWRVWPIDGANAPLHSIACPAPSLCVASDGFGNVLTSTSPTSAAWTLSAIDPGGDLVKIACASTRLCVALDWSGPAFASSDPASGTWRATGNTGIVAARGLACPAVFRCVAVTLTSAFTTDDPGEPAGPWAGTTNDADVRIRPTSIECPTVTLCLETESRGHLLVATSTTPMATVTTELTGSGHGTVSGPGLACALQCAGSYARGSTVTLSAAPAPGSTFSGWGGACAGSGTCTVDVVHDVDVTANFAAVPSPPGFNLTVTVGGSGSVSGPDIACPPRCGKAYAPGTHVTLTAKPGKGSTFRGWDGACSGTGRCDVVLESDVLATALFATAPKAKAKKPKARIGKLKRSGRGRRTVRIAFTTTPAHRAARCALVRGTRLRKPRYSSCRSPKTYKRLARGHYVFAVKPTGGSPVTRRFTVR